MAATSRTPDWGTWLVTAISLYTLAYVAWTLHPWPLLGRERLVNELADYPALIASVALMLRASHAVTEPRARRGWRLLALGCVMWTVANGIYDYTGMTSQAPAFPSLADVLFVACPPVALVALLTFPEQVGNRDERLIFALDATTLMVGGGVVILHFVLLPVAGGHGLREVALLSYYPLADLVLALCVVAVLFRHLPARTRRPLALLAAGYAALVVADLVYAHDTMAGTYTGVRVTDSLWTVGYATMAVAAHVQHRSMVAPTTPAAAVPARRLSSWLPLGAVAGSLAVLVLEAWVVDTSSLRVIVVGNVVLVALVAARQLVAARENARIQGEIATRASAARFRTMVMRSTDVISIVAADGELRYLSPSGHRRFGIDPDDTPPPRLLELVHPDDQEAARQFLARLVDSAAAPASATWRQRERGGGWLDLEVVGTNALADPAIGGLVLNSRDVSERVELERERERARVERDEYQRRLLHAEKMEALGRLAGGVAHDMNNAMSSIITTAELMAEETAEPSVRADAEAILLGARRAAELTRNLLGFARRGPTRREVLRPETVVTSAVDMLARSLPPGIRVETSFADELAAIEGDPTQLHHALVNLCINASDAMSGVGRLTVGAHLIDVGDDQATAGGVTPGRYVSLSVHDTGAGMDEATRQRVFEPFFTTKGQGRGTGLGLAMVYGTARHHGGAVEVDSAPGRGSTFRILLPASAARVPEPALRTVTAPPAPPVDARRVLLVDDEPLLRSMTQRLLEKHGYAVTVAAHGQEGMEVLAAADAAFDLVLLDMAMPVMAGPEMFRRARAAHPDLRVLLTSGFAAAADVQSLLRDGALGLVHKPYSQAVLLDAVAAAIRGHRVDPSVLASRTD